MSALVAKYAPLAVLAVSLCGLGFSFMPGLRAAHEGFAALTTAWTGVPAPDGPFGVDRRIVALAPIASRSGLFATATIDARLYLPRGLHAPDGKAPLLVVLPAMKGRNGDLDGLNTTLASRGFAVLALDDLIAAGPFTGADEDVRLRLFDFTDARAFESSQQRGARRVELAAARASEAIDRLAALQGADAAYGAIDARRIVAVGYSFGGATAAALPRLDPRVKGAINIDGALFGPEREGGIFADYLTIIGDHRAPPKADPESADAFERLQDQRDIANAIRDGSKPRSAAVTIVGAKHGSFDDRAFAGSNVLLWLSAPPARVRRIVVGYVFAFARGIYLDDPHYAPASSSPPEGARFASAGASS